MPAISGDRSKSITTTLVFDLINPQRMYTEVNRTGIWNQNVKLDEMLQSLSLGIKSILSLFFTNIPFYFRYKDWNFWSRGARVSRFLGLQSSVSTYFTTPEWMKGKMSFDRIWTQCIKRKEMLQRISSGVLTPESCFSCTRIATFIYKYYALFIIPENPVGHKWTWLHLRSSPLRFKSEKVVFTED